MSSSEGFFGGCITTNGENCMANMCNRNAQSGNRFQDERLTVKLQADQPVVPVPVYQELWKRDKYIEVPTIELQDTYQPKIYTQNAVHDVPHMELSYNDKSLNLQKHTYVEKPVEVPVNMGYVPKFNPTWDIRQVPRPVPVHTGTQQIINVDVPQIQYNTKTVEKEVVVDIKKTIIPKIVQVEKEVDVTQYKWVQHEKAVPIYKYVPKFQVELECPPPIIVPYPQTTIVEDPPIYETNTIHGMENHMSELKLSNENYANHFAKQYTNDYTLNSYNGENVLNAQLSNNNVHLAEVTPMPTPQVDNESWFSKYLNIGKGDKNSKWKFWPFNNEDSNCCNSNNQNMNNTMDPNTGYPTNMPNDFRDYFNTQPSNKQLNSEKELPDGCDLEPKIEYKGAINKAPQYGGSLEAISFKLHAIEVHQFIPLPNVKTPEFIQNMPSGATNVDTEKLQQLFGPVSNAWAHPDITGMPAPMMNDILQRGDSAYDNVNEDVEHSMDQNGYANQDSMPPMFKDIAANA